VAHYQSENYFAIDPVLKPENFSQGHLPWNDTLFRDAQPLWDAARNHGLRKGMTQCLMLPNRAFFYLYRVQVSVTVALRAMKWSSGCSFWYGKVCLY
jgi:LuxR family transcriptional regulator